MYLSNRAGKKKECFPSVKTIAEGSSHFQSPQCFVH
ncbi:MAG: hypothetical protein V8T22_02350 [Oscillospiraceae bacterium]